MKLKWILALAGVLTAHAAFAAPSTVSTFNVTSLNQQLQTNKTGWVAKETSLSHLTGAELRHRFGLNEKLVPEIEFVNLHSAKTLNALQALPASLDWRNNGGNWVSPLLNQANCGSCVAFASIGVMETQERIASGNPNYNISLSPQNLFACGGGACEQGWMPEDAASFLQSRGVVDEACQPYTSGATGEDVACSATCKDASKRTYKIARYSQPTSYIKDVEKVKAALQKGPLVTTIMVYEDFMSYSSGVYKHAAGKFLGGHAVSIIGYDDAAQAFIIRNSWGPEWGENGFGRVSYTDRSGIGSQTWAYEIPSPAGSVFIQSPRDYTYVASTLDLKTQSTFASTDSLSVTILDASGKAVVNTTCAADCSKSLDISGLSDGRYEIVSIALDKTGHELGHSPNQGFIVANKQPAISIGFTGKGVDLKSNLKDRVEFAITTSSTSVPLSSIEFHFKNAQGVEVVKQANVVINSMSMGWRTNLVPNGRYEIWMTGHVKTNSYDVVASTPHLAVTTLN